MTAGNCGKRNGFRAARAIALAGCVMSVPFFSSAAAAPEIIAGIPANIDENAKLLLTAAELVYDRDQQKIIAVGGVQIHYSGYQLTAKRVEYNQKTGTMTAIGKVEFVEPGGNRMYAEKLDVTDDFANGFISALRIETTDKTHLAAVSARRIDTDELILENGVYTACEPCKDHPERPPLWQIKAERVVSNGKTHTMRLEKARFELFGAPIAYIPVLELPDHTVKRKSGFLFPEMSTAQNLGFSVSVPYYHVLSPTMDATLTTTGYTSQGVLMKGEFRQRFRAGTHSLTLAGISQMRPTSFDAGTSDALADNRAMAASKGEFVINPRWAFGWDVMVQSDNNFSRTYSLLGTDDSIHTNQARLTGIGNRNFLDIRSFYFDVQDADPNNLAEHEQAIVHPVLDYNYFHPTPVAGGQLSVTSNMTSLTRTSTDAYDRILDMPVKDRFAGLAGTSSRLTSEAEWKRSFILPVGLVLTPMLAVRGDAFQLDVNNPAHAYDGNFHSDNSATRSMLTAGLEARYPIVFSTDNSSHIFEPIGQIYARPNEPLAGALPNEDAQSFVFDATNLFERDKFSGFDRVEGGTRANIGLRYTGTLESGYTLRSIAGQSFHLAGKNSFAAPDLVNVGADSGLETDRSDYVGMAGIDMPNGISMAWGNRFDGESLKIQRTDATIGYDSARFDTDLTYTQIAAQSDYGFPTRNDEIQSASAIKIKDYWSVFGALTWDINNDILSRRGVGFSYDDECTIFTVAFAQNRDISRTAASDWEIGARLSFRTLGDVKIGNTTLPGFQ